MAVLRKGGSYRFSALDPQRGNWPQSWQSRVAGALARRGWTGTLIWLHDPVAWWTVLPSIRCNKDAVLVWLDVEVQGANLPVDLLESAMNEAIGCLEITEVGADPGLPPDHAGEPLPVPQTMPAWLRTLAVGVAIYFGLSALSELVSLAASTRRLVGAR